MIILCPPTLTNNNLSRLPTRLFKIDIEGTEFSEGGFQDWISSGALQTVSQIALELHIPDRPGDER